MQISTRAHKRRLYVIDVRQIHKEAFNKTYGELREPIDNLDTYTQEVCFVLLNSIIDNLTSSINPNWQINYRGGWEAAIAEIKSHEILI